MKLTDLVVRSIILDTIQPVDMSEWVGGLDQFVEYVVEHSKLADLMRTDQKAYWNLLEQNTLMASHVLRLDIERNGSTNYTDPFVTFGKNADKIIGHAVRTFILDQDVYEMFLRQKEGLIDVNLLAKNVESVLVCIYCGSSKRVIKLEHSQRCIDCF